MTRIYMGKAGNRIKFVSDLDCLPPDCDKVVFYQELESPPDRSYFLNLKEFSVILELLGFDVCIDFGKGMFYETDKEE